MFKVELNRLAFPEASFLDRSELLARGFLRVGAGTATEGGKFTIEPMFAHVHSNFYVEMGLPLNDLAPTRESATAVSIWHKCWPSDGSHAKLDERHMGKS